MIEVLSLYKLHLSGVDGNTELVYMYHTSMKC